MAEQHVFYILGSIFFGLFAVIFLMTIALLMYISHVVSKIERLSQEIGREVLDAVRKTASYARHLGGYGLGGFVANAFRMHAKWRKHKASKYSEDDED